MRLVSLRTARGGRHTGRSVSGPRFPELGFYALPGHVADPARVADEVVAGDALGFGSVWISERLNTKSVEVLSGIAAAQDTGMGIAAGLIANLPLRHPLVVAAYGSTMSLLTGNRFALGIGRGQALLADAAGVARLDFRLLEDWITILRALWRGEAVSYDGPAGKLTGASLGMALDAAPPLIMSPVRRVRSCRQSSAGRRSGHDRDLVSRATSGAPSGR